MLGSGYYEVERCTFRSVKLLWRTQEELIRKLNALRAREIVSIKPDCPDETTTANCSRVYYSCNT